MGIAGSIQKFEEYVTRFARETAPEQKNIDLKKDHTLRVLEEARRIIVFLGLAQDQACPVELAALYHDLGRFLQFAMYRTFQDRLSINHGLLGYRELKKTDWLNNLSGPDKKRILLTVLMHNRAEMARGLPIRLDTMLRIVRDADKLDVVSVLMAHLTPGAQYNPVVTLGLADEPERFSKPALQQVESRRMVRYEQMKRLNDFKLLLLSWIYDLNFAWTRQEFLRREYVQQIMQTLPQSKEMRTLEQQLLADLV
ncbi:MAG: HD domain-containing protein [Desulfohalobiaceae bacterium]|nr:HD domain-containing protein [Desulfohalobiaceae bacterium]